MHRTIFDTPGVNTFLRWFSIGFFSHRLENSWAVTGQWAQKRIDCSASYQQLGFALHLDGGFCAAFKCVLDGQAVAF